MRRLLLATLFLRDPRPADRLVLLRRRRRGRETLLLDLERLRDETLETDSLAVTLATEGSLGVRALLRRATRRFVLRRLLGEADEAGLGALGTLAVRRRALRFVDDFFAFRALRERLFDRLLDLLLDLLVTDRDRDMDRNDTDAGVVLRPEVGLFGVLALRRRLAFLGFLRLDEREREELRLREVLVLREDEADRFLGARGTEALRRLFLRARRLVDLLRDRDGDFGFFAFLGFGFSARFLEARFSSYAFFSSWYALNSSVFWYAAILAI